MHMRHLIRHLLLGVLALMALAMVVFLWWFVSTFVVTTTSVTPKDLAPSLADIQNVADWEGRAPGIRAQLDDALYGPVPTTEVDWKVTKKVLDAEAFSGKAVYELWTLRAPESELALNIVALIPKSDTPLPLLVGSNFCPNHIRYPDFDLPAPKTYPGMCGTKTVMTPVFHAIFGSFIETFPFADFVEKNIAFANIYLAEGVADDAVTAYQDLKTVSAVTGVPIEGALAAWAWEFIETVRIFEEDNRIDDTRTALYGHSRDGKAAFLAAAHSARIDLVLAHQSGKGGAAPWQHKVGETVEAITTDYPYWFRPDFKNYADDTMSLPVDQHELLALIAPRPVLISTAWWDKWGDPAGSLLAAQSASHVYELYGVPAITQNKLDDYTPSASLAFFIRPLTHGVRASDWEAFFEFLDAHFDL